MAFVAHSAGADRDLAFQLHLGSGQGTIMIRRDTVQDYLYVNLAPAEEAKLVAVPTHQAAGPSSLFAEDIQSVSSEKSATHLQSVAMILLLITAVLLMSFVFRAKPLELPEWSKTSARVFRTFMRYFRVRNAWAGPSQSVVQVEADLRIAKAPR